MDKKNKITRICMWSAISAMTVLAGLFLFIWLMRIWTANKENVPVYTRENVGQALLQILAVLILWVVFVVAGGVLSYFQKLDDNAPARGSSQMKLAAILYRVSNAPAEHEEMKKLTAEKNMRKIVWTIVFVLELIAALFIFLYLINKSNFTTELTPLETMLELVIHTVPFLLVILALHLCGALFEEASLNRSIEAAKKLLKEFKGVRDAEPTGKKQKYVVWGIRGGVIALGVILVIVGLATGGCEFVLRNAITICSACIGLG